MKTRQVRAGALVVCVLSVVPGGTPAAVRAQEAGVAADAPGVVLPAEKDRFTPADIVRPDGLPALGKWMIDPDGTPAHWLGGAFGGKALREPINIVILDPVARSPEEAQARLMDAAARAGYPSRRGHSSGYQAYIGGTLHAQLPTERRHAFSDAPYEFSNNHGRIFGPLPYDGTYVFVGAFSREKIGIFARPEHEYRSFDVARDDFAENLDRKTAYEMTGFVEMNNSIANDPLLTTGDHDGRAVRLDARQ